MKNIKRILIFAILISFFGCQQEDEIYIQDTERQTIDMAKYNAEVVDGMLYFASRKDYEDTIDYLISIGDENFENWEKEISFSSMRAKFTEEELEKTGIENNLIATLLNPEAKIQIGSNVFEIDKKNELISVTSTANYYGNNNLFSKSNIKTFSTNENVLDRIDDLENGINYELRAPEGDEGRFCKRNKVSQLLAVGSHLAQYKIVYQNGWGIFPVHSLQAKIKMFGERNSSGRFELGLKTIGNEWHDNYYEDKNNSYNYMDFSGNFSYEYKSIRNSSNIRVYYSRKRLKKYRFAVEFSFKDLNTEAKTTHKDVIICGNRRIDPKTLWL